MKHKLLRASSILCCSVYIILMCFCNPVNAQQDPQYTMWWDNYSVYNPAATGVFGKHFVSLHGRHQWTGFEREPYTGNIIYDLKLKKSFGAVGVNYTYDQLGYSQYNTGNLNYAYQFNMAKERVLSFGLSAGIQTYTFDGAGVLVPKDPRFANGTDEAFNMNAGAMYASHYWVLGLGVTHLNEPQFKSPLLLMRRHYYFNGSYKIYPVPYLELRPAFLLKFDQAKYILDLNLMATINNHVYTGVTYRRQDKKPDMCFILGVQFTEKLRIGYSYDNTLSAIGDFSNGSYELMLAYLVK